MDQAKRKKKIIREMPPIGTELSGKFKGVSGYSAKIVKDAKSPKGKAIKFDGKLYPSMTAAAIAVTNQPTNGWRFWRF